MEVRPWYLILLDSPLFVYIPVARKGSECCFKKCRNDAKPLPTIAANEDS